MPDQALAEAKREHRAINIVVCLEIIARCEGGIYEKQLKERGDGE